MQRLLNFLDKEDYVLFSSQPVTAKTIAQQSGFRSYTTFSLAFKNFMGTTVAEWMKNV